MRKEEISDEYRKCRICRIYRIYFKVYSKIYSGSDWQNLRKNRILKIGGEGGDCREDRQGNGKRSGEIHKKTSRGQIPCGRAGTGRKKGSREKRRSGCLQGRYDNGRVQTVFHRPDGQYPIRRVPSGGCGDLVHLGKGVGTDEKRS